MNRQVMTYLTIWLLTSESVQLSLLYLDRLCFALTSLRGETFPNASREGERCLFFHHTADDPLCCPGQAM